MKNSKPLRFSISQQEKIMNFLKEDSSNPSNTFDNFESVVPEFRKNPTRLRQVLEAGLDKNVVNQWIDDYEIIEIIDAWKRCTGIAEGEDSVKKTFHILDQMRKHNPKAYKKVIDEAAEEAERLGLETSEDSEE